MDNNDIENILELLSIKYNKIIFRTILSECRTGYQNKIMFYRGANDLYEEIVDSTNSKCGYSISYNTSILNGILCDNGACTYNYMIDNDAYKTYYLIERFFYNDDSVRDNLIYISPMHPYIQLMSKGELWHVRSKIFKGGVIKGIKKFAGIYDDYDFDEKKFPDYLKSKFDKNTMMIKFKTFIAKNRKELIDTKLKEHVEANLFGGKYLYNKSKYMKIHKIIF